MDKEPKNHSVQFVESTYSQTDNSFATNLVSTDNLNHGTNNDAQNQHSSNHLTNTNRGRRTRRATLTRNILVDSFVDASKTNWLLTYLLGAACLTTILNTILLSFIFKSVQLNEAGLLNGHIALDDQLAGTIMKLPVQLAPGKSIITKAIGSPSLLHRSPPVDNQPEPALKFRAWPGDNENHMSGFVAPNNNRIRAGTTATIVMDGPDKGKKRAFIFLSSQFASDHSDGLQKAHQLNGREVDDLDSDGIGKPTKGDKDGFKELNIVAEPNSPSALLDKRNGSAAESKSNYMAVNLNSTSRDGCAASGLEIGTGLLVLNLLSEVPNNHHNRRPSTGSNKQVAGTTHTTNQPPLDTNNITNLNARSTLDGIEQSEQPGDVNLATTSGHLTFRQNRLLELDDAQQSISLPQERHINMDSSEGVTPRSSQERPSMPSSLLVNEQLTCQDITGSLDSELDIQTRNGNLICSSFGDIKLISRSADLRLSSFEEFVLHSNKLHLTGLSLFIPSGIEHVDSDSFEAFKGSRSNAQRVQSKKAITGTSRRNNANKSSSQQLRSSNSHYDGKKDGDDAKKSSNDSQVNDPVTKLRAYDLVLVNGSMMAAGR